MNKKINYLILIFLLFSSTLHAQIQRDTLIENGKVFLVHKVIKGETLYGLSKTYNITIEDIIKYNPHTENGIKIDEEIKIYIKDATTSTIQQPKKEEKDKTIVSEQIHIVEAGETLYGIARKYEVSINQLFEWNPDVSENISIGQHILIHGKNIPPHKDSILPIQEHKKGIKKSSYNVYALIPLYLNNIHRIDTSKFKSLSDYDAVKSFHFIQFYEGLLIAAEDASKKEIPIKLYVEDVNEQNVHTFKDMIQQNKFADADLIIGPFFGDLFSIMCDYAKDKDIIVVNPFSISFDDCNSVMYKVSTSYQNQAKQAGNYITQLHDKAQIILVNNQSTNDISITSAYKTGLLQSISDKKQISIKEVNYQKEGIGGIQNALNPDCENYVFTFFTGEINITNFIQRMYGLKRENITLFAPSSWIEYDNIETEYFMALKTHYIDPFFVDYADVNVSEFINKFRDEFETEPTIEKFAFQGYDITCYFLNALMEYGCNFGTEANPMQLPLLSTQFFFEKNPKGFFENTFVHIYKLEDYNFIDAIKDLENIKKEQTTPTINPE